MVGWGRLADQSSVGCGRMYDRVRYGRKAKHSSVDCLRGYDKVGWLNNAV